MLTLAVRLCGRSWREFRRWMYNQLCPRAGAEGVQHIRSSLSACKKLILCSELLIKLPQGLFQKWHTHVCERRTCGCAACGDGGIRARRRRHSQAQQIRSESCTAAQAVSQSPTARAAVVAPNMNCDFLCLSEDGAACPQPDVVAYFVARSPMLQRLVWHQEQ